MPEEHKIHLFYCSKVLFAPACTPVCTNQILTSSIINNYLKWPHQTTVPHVYRTNIDEPVIGDLPAGLEPHHVHRARLLGGEVGQGRVRHVVRLQPQLFQYNNQK